MKEEKLTPDIILKNYWDGENEFADFCNAVLFDGEEVILPQELEDRNTASAVVLETEEQAASFENFRDNAKIHKKADFNEEGPVLLCIESQTYISYPMPMRVMGYDNSSYDRQYRQNASRYSDSKALKGSEYLSHMRKTDRFLPVITIVVSYCKDPWDGPTCLRDMLNIPARLERYVNDYRFPLVEARSCSLNLHNPNNIHLFSMLKIALNNHLSAREGRTNLIRYADTHKPSRKVLMTVSGILNFKIDYRKYEREEMTMETIFDDMFMEWKAEGKAEGRVEGKAEGRAEGKAEGKTQGRAEEIVSIYREEGYPDQFILEKLQSKLNMAVDAAKEFLMNYGKQTA